MIRQPSPPRIAAAALAITLAAGTGLTGPQAFAQPSAVTQSSTLSQSASAVSSEDLQAEGAPPAGSLRISSRYIDSYKAKRATWSDVVNHGAPLPKVSATCKKKWSASGKDSRLSWKSANYLCLNQLKSRGQFLPQGIGGSATTRGYSIGGKPAADRNLILTSWYSKKREPGLFAPNKSGESVTRLVVLDMNKKRYRTVELVRPDGHNKLRNLNSHGSGLVWAGQYIYVSSKSVLLVFNADDILNINGRYVLPAVARWTVHGLGGLSSMSIDRSTSPDQLKTINYTKSGLTYVQDFALRSDGLLASRSTPTANDMYLRNAWGEKKRVVHSTRSAIIPGASYQGVGAVGSYCFASSSAITTSQSRNRKVDAIAVFKNGKLAGRFQMPRGNVESVYVDYKRNLYTSITEGGSQFLFSIPYRRITKAAGN